MECYAFSYQLTSALLGKSDGFKRNKTVYWAGSARSLANSHPDRLPL